MSDFLHDRNKDSVISGPCLWVKRASKTSDPVLVTDLDTSLTEIPDDSIVKPKQDIYTPNPEDTTLPDPERYVELVRDVQPNACMLDAWEIRQNTTEEMIINVKLPMEKTVAFWKAHLLHPCSQECIREILQYLSEDIVKIEEGTREQYTNPNWKSARNVCLQVKISKLFAILQI